MGEAGAAVTLFGKISSLFSIPVTRHYSKFDQNIPCDSRVKSTRPADMMLGEVSSPFRIPVAGQ